MPSSQTWQVYFRTIMMLPWQELQTPAIRQRMVWIGEHSIKFTNGSVMKLLGEFHSVPASSQNASKVYAADNGWVAGVKFNNPLKTNLPGSFNQFSVRYGTGIANGGDNGNTFTWATYGASGCKWEVHSCLLVYVSGTFVVELIENN